MANIPDCSEHAVSKWMDESDAVCQFAGSKLALLTGPALAKTEGWAKGTPTIYDAYKCWCKDDGHGAPLSSLRFLRRLNKWLKEKLPTSVPASSHRDDGEYYPVRLRDHRGDAAMVVDITESEIEQQELVDPFSRSDAKLERLTCWRIEGHRQSKASRNGRMGRYATR